MKSYRAMIDHFYALNWYKKAGYIILLVMPFGFCILSLVTIIKLLSRGSKS